MFNNSEMGGWVIECSNWNGSDITCFYGNREGTRDKEETTQYLRIRHDVDDGIQFVLPRRFLPGPPVMVRGSQGVQDVASQGHIMVQLVAHKEAPQKTLDEGSHILSTQETVK